MKTQIHFALVIATVLTFVSLTSASAQATFQKGAQRLLQTIRPTEHVQIKTQADIDSLKPNDMIAMACAKCKSVTVMFKKELGKNRFVYEPGTKHACPGCQTKISYIGHGKGKDRIIKHKCEGCGDESVFCCATNPKSGPTEGMTAGKSK